MPEDNTANSAPQPLPSSASLPDPLAQQNPVSTQPDVSSDVPQTEQFEPVEPSVPAVAPVSQDTPSLPSPTSPVSPTLSTLPAQPEPMIENVSQPTPYIDTTPVSSLTPAVPAVTQDFSMPAESDPIASPTSFTNEAVQVSPVEPSPAPVTDMQVTNATGSPMLPPLDTSENMDNQMANAPEPAPMPTPVIDAGTGVVTTAPDAEASVPGMSPGQPVSNAIPQPQPILGTEVTVNPDTMAQIPILPDMSSMMDSSAVPGASFIPSPGSTQLPVIPEPQVTASPGESRGGMLAGKNRVLYIVIAVLLVAVIVAASIILYQLTN